MARRHSPLAAAGDSGARAAKRARIEATMIACRGNTHDTARALGIDPRQMTRAAYRAGITREEWLELRRTAAGKKNDTSETNIVA